MPRTRATLEIERRAKDRLTELFGVSLEDGGAMFRAFPEPGSLAICDDAALAGAIRNARKITYVRAVAEAFADVDERWLLRGDYDDVRAWLLAIPGIGEWSALSRRS